MKAMIVTEFGAPDVMKLVEIPIPPISDDEVLIKVMKTSVNYADIKTRYGNKTKGTFPFILGLDAAGVVEKVGQKVKHIKEGERVIAFPKAGSYAEYVVASSKLTYVLPNNVSFDIAAACPTVSFLSYKLLSDIARIEKGESVLIHSAAGGVGTTAVQMAKLLGAHTVIGTVGNVDKVEVVIRNGADEVICYEKENFAQKVNEYTGGKGVNIVLDSIAGDITSTSFECLAPYGRLVQFGNSSGREGTIKTSDVHASCRSILGFSLGTTRKNKPDILRQTSEKVLQFLKEDKLKFEIAHSYSLEEAAAAHKLIESRLSVGKILLDVSSL